MKNSFSFFKNTECEYFPCHNSTDKEDFNCLFCFCPLYCLDDCGGNYKLAENGIKDCSDCMLPHMPSNYKYIISKLSKKDDCI